MNQDWPLTLLLQHSSCPQKQTAAHKRLDKGNSEVLSDTHKHQRPLCEPLRTWVNDSSEMLADVLSSLTSSAPKDTYMRSSYRTENYTSHPFIHQ